MAITLTPGQIVSSTDWDALFTQHGGMANDTPATRQAPTEADIKAAALAGDDDPASQQRPVYRYALVDGSYVDARTSPDGKGWQVVDYKPSPKFTQAQAKATANDPAQQTPAQQNEAALNAQRAKNAALPGPNPQGATEEERRGQDPRYETDEDRASRADARIKEQGALARADAEKNKPQVIGGTLNTTSPQYAVVGPDGSVTWAANPNYQNPSPKPLTLPNTRTISWANADGTITTEKNPNYVKPSKIIPNPSDPRKMVNVTEDDQGNPVILPVDDKTTIKPADLPVLQAKFGEISQGLGALAQDLNSKVARGDITPQERTQAFEAAHAQASTQVAEINSILENSRAIWSQQVTQRGQTLGETQSRRSYAQSIATNAMQAGQSVAAHSGKGSGAAIAGGVEALMRMGQRYAEGMGGFKESPEIGLPPALQQAQGISLPGYGPNAGAPPSPPPPPSGANVDATNAAAMAQSRSAFGGLGIPPVGAPAAGAPAGPGGPPPSGISNTTDAGGVPREYSPASSTVGSGIPPAISGMGSALQGAQGYAGEPVAAGGAGVWNPDATVQGMLGDGSDPAWAEAVRRAAQAHGGMRR